MTLRAALSAIARFRKKYPELSKCNYVPHKHLIYHGIGGYAGLTCFNALDADGKHFLIVVPCAEEQANSEALLTAEANLIKSLPCPTFC